MKKFLILWSVVIIFATGTSAFGQQQKHAVSGSLLSKEKSKSSSGLDSVTSVTPSTQPPHCNFRKESEDETEVDIPYYLYESWVQSGLQRSVLTIPRFVSYNFGWGTVVINKVTLYPDIAFTHW